MHIITKNCNGCPFLNFLGFFNFKGGFILYFVRRILAIQ